MPPRRIRQGSGDLSYPMVYNALKEKSMERMLGVKVYDSSFCTDRYLDSLQQVGFNTVFLGRGALNQTVADNLNRRGLFWNIVEPVFLVTEDEQCALATQINGSPAEDDWVRFACPTDSEHLDHVRKRIESDILQFNPPGVSLDFLRFFQFWEMTDPLADPRNLARTCYCERCKKQAKSFISESLWRRGLVTGTAIELSSLARSFKDNLRIGIHAVPWTRSLFDGAREEVIGQSFSSLSEVADYLTPMAYHHMMHMQPSYIKELISDMADEGCKHIVPSIQSKEAYRTDAMSASEFKEALKLALQNPSEGVLIYKWEDLCQDKERLEIVKEAIS